MRLAKTDLARAALQSRDPALGALERRVLILSDGQRTDADLAALLGAGAAAAIARLLATGLLQLPPARGASPARDGDARPDPVRAEPHRSPEPPVGDAPVGAPQVPADPAATAPTATKRSLVAARLYLLDMLALQRGVDTRALQAALREARTGEAMLDTFADAMVQLHRSASPSYCERVGARLLEVLPLDQLDAWSALDRRRCEPGTRPGDARPLAQLQPST